MRTVCVQRVSKALFICHSRSNTLYTRYQFAKKQKRFLPHPRVKVSIVGSIRDREVACSASDRQGSNFESCVWRAVSSQSSHHPQEVLLAQFSLYVHKGGLKPVSFHFATSLRRFSQSGYKLLLFIFLCVDCSSFMCDWDKPRSTETQRI